MGSCVPVDFSSINEALKHCPRTKKNSLLAGNDKSVVFSDVGTVVLMPGVYVDERIDIGGEPWSVGHLIGKSNIPMPYAPGGHP